MLKLDDVQLFAAFGLLDRFAAAASSPILPGPGAFAFVLATMLVALKAQGTHRDLERAKKLVAELSPWDAVRRAEIDILRCVYFRVCTPTSRDLLDSLLGKTLREGVVGYDAKSLEQCRDLARFLLELGLVYEPEAVYGGCRPPLAPAVSAALLAIIAVGGPHSSYAIHALHKEPIGLLDGDRAVVQIAEAMRQRWATEERRLVERSGSVVLDKWRRRVGSFSASPPLAADLQRLVAESAAQATSLSASGPVNSLTLALSTPQQDAADLPRRSTLQQPLDSVAVAEASHRAFLDPGPPQSIPVLMPNPRLSGSAQAAQKQSSVFASLGNTAENFPTQSKQPLPQGASNRSPDSASEHPVDLAQVINMISAQGLEVQGSQHFSESKPKTSSVAAHFLMSSALRKQWPAGKRKFVEPSDAAALCKGAAAALEEAALQLADMATALEGQLQEAAVQLAGPAAKPLAEAPMKRRRKQGGPAAVPFAQSPPLRPGARGSPPVRLAVVRV